MQYEKIIKAHMVSGEMKVAEETGSGLIRIS